MNSGMGYAEARADTVDVASRRMGISKRQLYREIGGGRLIICKVGKRTLVERSEQSRWLASCRVEPAIPADLQNQLGVMSVAELQAMVDGRPAGQAAASDR